MKVGITKKMLEKIQAGGLAFSGNGDNFKVKKVVRLEGSGDEDACWLGNKALTNGPVYLAVPAYEFEDADIAVGDVINLNFSDAITVNQISTPSELFGPYDPERYVTVGQTVKIKILKDSELATLKKNGFYGYANVTGGNLISIIVAPTLGATSFDFNKVKIATSNNSSAGDIIPENLDGATELVIVDGESNATMTIAPNLKQGDFPEEAFARSCFWSTLAGPQLRLTGGYTGMTVKVESANAFNKLAFSQTNFSSSTVVDKGVLDVKNGEWSAGEGVTVNDVTFTLKADTTEIWKDGKLVEVILNDMGQWWINKIEVDPISDVVVAPADGADLGAVVNAEMAKYAKPKSLTIDLTAGANYTTSQSIKTNVPLIINGNGAGIDATGLEAPFIALDLAASGTVPQLNQEVYEDAQAKDYNLLDEVTIDDVMIKNLKGSIISSNGQDWALVNLNITKSIIQLDNDGTTFIRFDQTKSNKGVIKNINIQNNTIYNISSKSAYFIRYANASNAAKAFGTNNGTSTYDYNFSNNTLINTFKDTNFGNNTVNNSKTAITMKNNIFVDVKNITKFAQGNCEKTLEGNFTWGSVTAEETVAKAVDAGFTTPVAALDLTKANGGLNLTPTGEAKDAGDPRWLGGSGAGEVTGIENVKNATVEDGAWYTVSGQRVAQPTKGLYIHNGKKVVIK